VDQGMDSSCMSEVGAWWWRFHAMHSEKIDLRCNELAERKAVLHLNDKKKKKKKAH
jgi:hypothetical protein